MRTNTKQILNSWTRHFSHSISLIEYKVYNGIATYRTTVCARQLSYFILLSWQFLWVISCNGFRKRTSPASEDLISRKSKVGGSGVSHVTDAYFGNPVTERVTSSGDTDNFIKILPNFPHTSEPAGLGAVRLWGVALMAFCLFSVVLFF